MSQNNQGHSQESFERIARKPPRRTAFIFGGWLTISAGVLSLANGVTGIFGESSTTFGLDVGFSRTDLCGIILIAFGIVSIAGGMCALRGRYLFLSFAGAFLGMMGGGLIGFWLGLGALIVFAVFGEDI